MLIVIVTLETPNFRFEAVGSTEAEAMELLEEAWSRHFDGMRQPADMLSFDAVMEAADTPHSRYFVTSRALQVGAAYRDGQQVCAASPIPG